VNLGELRRVRERCLARRSRPFAAPPSPRGFVAVLVHWRSRATDDRDPPHRVTRASRWVFWRSIAPTEQESRRLCSSMKNAVNAQKRNNPAPFLRRKKGGGTRRCRFVGPGCAGPKKKHGGASPRGCLRALKLRAQRRGPPNRRNRAVSRKCCPVHHEGGRKQRI